MSYGKEFDPARCGRKFENEIVMLNILFQMVVQANEQLLYYAYLIIMDSITFPASSHLSVTISITW
jgi:hypothetical protein